MNLFTKQRLTDLENRLMVDKGEGGWEGMDWEFGLADANYYIYIQ